MQRFVWSDLDKDGRVSALARPSGLTSAEIETSVKSVLKRVRDDGDFALRDYTAQFDDVIIDDFQVAGPELEAAWRALPQVQKDALEQAKRNIEMFHTAQKPEALRVETMPGVVCERLPRAIQCVGLYVPGGTAPLVSTVLMLAVPAQVAGVDRAVMVTPPQKDGSVNPAVLAAAYLCGITEVYKVGGAQAIAALTYGTKTIPKVAKIFGPGNAYVAMAKSLVSSELGGPAIDLPAGPSEAMVLADAKCNPNFVASDLLSQAEHDVLSQVVCVCTEMETADKVEAAIAKQIQNLSRKDVAQTSLKSGRMIIAERSEMPDIVNIYAPEHLIVQVDNPEELVPSLRNTGSVFLGPWTPESIGDYASGTNHTLPTSGAARAYSGVNVESFMTQMTVQRLTATGMRALGPTVEILADMEGLDAHKSAVSLRLEALS